MLDELVQLLKNESNQNLSTSFFKLSLPDQFRALCNVRPAVKADKRLLELQDKYLQILVKEKGIVDVNKMEGDLVNWQGDITRLNSDAIVNACNAQLLGCFQPLHNCIDNIIHTYAGIQVRKDCNEIMRGKKLPNGEVKVTKAYNLPSKYIFHTVGPIVRGLEPTAKDQIDLKNCYLNSLIEAKKMNLESITFCCISTGVYSYPNEKACELAVEIVKNWQKENPGLKVIFNTFLDEDTRYYEKQLSK
ncbi:MAG: protein-ADP-ribose hydrolase [Bacteroidales bacterium]